MNWFDKIYSYCERAGQPHFWAEPFNAVTNAAFLIAALAAAFVLWRERKGEARGSEAALIALVAMMGVGSFLFHTYATRWASWADKAPIGIFMLAYLVYALRRYFKAPWLVALMGLGLFVWSLKLAGGVTCDTAGLLPLTAQHAKSCLNGTAGYLPAFGVLLLMGVVLAALRDPVSPYLLSAAAVFSLSMAFRTLDWELCDVTVFMGRGRGTHALWHVLNATTLYLLVLGAIRHGRRAA